MDVTENTGISFAVNTLDDIPTPKKNAKEITGLVKRGGKSPDTNFRITGSLTKKKGLPLQKPGKLQVLALRTAGGPNI